MPAHPLNRRQACGYLAAAALAAGTSAATAAGEGARWSQWPLGRATPSLELPDLDDVQWRLTQALGRPVLLNFWASWCEPCRAELPSLQRLQGLLAASQLQVVAVNFREGREVVRRLRETQGSSLVWLRDSYGDAARAWGVRSFPSTFVINAPGQVLLRVEGGLDWASPAVQHRLQALL